MQFKVQGLCSDLGLYDLILKPTRLNNILDHVLISKDLTKSYNPDKVVYDAPIGSADHKILFCAPDTVETSHTTIRWHTVYDFRLSCLTRLRCNADALDWENLLFNAANVDEMWNKFHSSIKDIFTQCIPCQLVPMSRKDKDWITPLTKKLITDRWRAFRAGDMESYKRLKDKVKREIQKSKQLWAQKQMQTTKGLWKLVTHHNPKHRGDISTLINGPLDTLIDEVTDHLTNHFTKPNTSIMEPDTLLDDDWKPQFTEYQVMRSLQRYSIAKSGGSDDIPTRIYVELAELISRPLAKIFNQSVLERRFPTEWKKARIVAIPKTNQPDPTKMRYLSLLPVPSKIFEKLVLSTLRREFEKAYGNEQHAFRRNSSTTTALLRITDAAAKIFDDVSMFGVAILNYDMSSAFDHVDHATTISMLSKLDFPRGFIRWLASYLLDRTGRLQVNGKSSPSINIEKGVPQGSVLGPALFCSYIRDFNAANSSTTIVKYADDLSLIVPIKARSSSAICELVNSETTEVARWCQKINLSLNTAKSNCLLVTRQRNANLSLTDLTISNVPSTKLLGVHLNKALNWDTHIEYLRIVCSRRLHILRRLRPLIPRAELHTVYEATVRSLLEYACPVFVGLSKKNSNILSRIERRAHKIMNTGDPNCDRCENNSLDERRLTLSTAAWKRIEDDPNHLLSPLIPAKLPRTKHYTVPYFRTDKLGNSFFPFMCKRLNSSSVSS